MHEVDINRVRLLQKGDEKKGTVVYWMSRDQRMHDNWALLFAQNLSLEKSEPLVVIFCLLPDFLGATLRQYGFMLKGLKELEAELGNYNIPFILLNGEPGIEIPKLVNDIKAAKLVAEFRSFKN